MGKPGSGGEVVFQVERGSRADPEPVQGCVISVPSQSIRSTRAFATQVGIFPTISADCEHCETWSIAAACRLWLPRKDRRNRGRV